MTRVSPACPLQFAIPFFLAPWRQCLDLGLPGAAHPGALDRGLNGGLLAVQIVAAGKPFQVGELVASFLCQPFAALFLLARNARLVKAEARARDHRHVVDRLCRQSRSMTVA